MPRALAGLPAQPDESLAQVVLETTMTVPTEHLSWVLAGLRKAGLEAWDTGARTTTEEALDALADVRVRFVP